MEVKSTRSCVLDQDKMGTTSSSFMECSICLDVAAEPVVTLCGHLYCWPCIYKWMQQQDHPGDCPVCKSHLSDDAIIPIYGRGRSTTSTGIPDRPSPRTSMVRDHQQRRRHGYDYDGGYMSSSASVLHSTAGGVLCAVMPWVSGGRSHEGRSPYVIGSNTGMRRTWEMRIESCLSQIWGFLFCWAMLCFLFF